MAVALIGNSCLFSFFIYKTKGVATTRMVGEYWVYKENYKNYISHNVFNRIFAYLVVGWSVLGAVLLLLFLLTSDNHNNTLTN